MKTAILVNYSANQNSGKKKWLRISDQVIKQLPGKPLIIPYETPFNIKGCVKNLIHEHGISCFISAGGDGSVNYLVNALISITGKASSNYCIGGIGLGSSNDFLKPVMKKINGVPVKIQPDKNNFSDVGKVTYLDPDNQERCRLFIINASLGITADANLLFNKGDRFIRFTKSRMVGISILYTALKTLARYRNKTITITTDETTKRIKIANISLTKSPYISGSFHYDQSPLRDGGNLGFHCTGDLNKMEIIKTLWDLSRGLYNGSPKRETSFISNLKIESDEPVALETDGEIQMGKKFTFSVIPRAICLAS